LRSSRGSLPGAKEILEKTGHVLHSAKVTDVLFTEFVVQF